MNKITEIINKIRPYVNDLKESQTTKSWYFALNGVKIRLSDHNRSSFRIGLSYLITESIDTNEFIKKMQDDVLKNIGKIHRIKVGIKQTKQKKKAVKKQKNLTEEISKVNLKFKDLKRDYDTLFDEYYSFKRSSELEMDELDKECDKWNNEYILAKAFIDTIKKSWIVKFYCLFDKQMKRQLKFYNK